MMASQLADAKLVDPRLVDDTVDHEMTGCCDANEDDGRTAVRGIVFGILLSSPFWALIAFTLYLLR